VADGAFSGSAHDCLQYLVSTAVPCTAGAGHPVEGGSRTRLALI
jgi:hypothetical protein